MNIISTDEKQLLKAIKSGHYRDCYLIYNRKSTDEPNNQKNSITYQKAENSKCAKREALRIAQITIKGFCVDGIVSERHSGFKEDNNVTFTSDGRVQFRIDRPKFQRVVQFLSLGLFRGLICLCWDRVSRNKGDDAIVRKLMRKGVDVHFVFAKYDQSSAGALHMDIDGMFAEHHSRVTSEKVRTTIRNLRDRGICTYRAPLGYLNKGTMENKPFDPVRAPIIKELFERYAQGSWSLEDLARWANAQGLTTRPMRRPRTGEEMLAEEDEDMAIEPVSRPMTANMIHKIITNPFYAGKILGNNHDYLPSNSHQPLISPSLFADVKRLLNGKRVSIHYTNKRDLSYRGLIRCGVCGRSYTPYEQKGIHYFSTRCRKGCANARKNFNVIFLEKKIGECLSTLHFTGAELIRIEAQARTDIAVFEEKRYRQLESNDRKKKKLREDLSYLVSNKLDLLKTGVYTPDALRNEETRLSTELTDLCETEEVSDAAMLATLHDVVTLSELLKIATQYHTFAKTPEKEEITRLVFSELSLTGNVLEYKTRKGFAPFENRLVALCEPMAWLSEAILSNKERTDSILILKQLLARKRAQPP